MDTSMMEPSICDECDTDFMVESNLRDEQNM